MGTDNTKKTKTTKLKMTKASLLILPLFSMTAALQHWGSTPTEMERTGPLPNTYSLETKILNKAKARLSCDDELRMLEVMSEAHQFQHALRILTTCNHSHYKKLIFNRIRQNKYLLNCLSHYHARRKRRS